MKFFSWSTLALIVSVAFLWGCGYWVLLQTGAVVVQQQRTELSHQLDKAVVALQHWQDRYELPLQALQQRLNALPAQQSEVLATDPWQELDLHIEQILWPDPLQAYAVVNMAGKVLRFSDDSADQLFSHSRRLPAQQLMFLAPQVYRSHWMLPVQVPISNPGHTAEHDVQLILWFDGARLAAQLDAMRPESAAESEFLLVDNAGALLSRSRYQDRLLPMLRMDDIQGWQPLQLWLRRPPVPLLDNTAQKFDATLAWSPSHIVSLLRQKGPAFSQKTYLNYLGRPTLAAWQHLDSWQANLLLERDASVMLAHIAKQRQQLFFVLLGISLALVVLFFVVQRRLQWSEHMPFTDPASPMLTDISAETIPSVPPMVIDDVNVRNEQRLETPREPLPEPLSEPMIKPMLERSDISNAAATAPITSLEAGVHEPPHHGDAASKPLEQSRAVIPEAEVVTASDLTPALLTVLQAHVAADDAVTSSAIPAHDDWQMASRLLEAWMYAQSGTEHPQSRQQLSVVTQLWLQQQSTLAPPSSGNPKVALDSATPTQGLSNNDPALKAIAALLSTDCANVIATMSAPQDLVSPKSDDGSHELSAHMARSDLALAAIWQRVMAGVTTDMVVLPTRALIQRWLRLLQQQIPSVQTAVIAFTDQVPAWIAVSNSQQMSFIGQPSIRQPSIRQPSIRQPSMRDLEQQFLAWAHARGAMQSHVSAVSTPHEQSLSSTTASRWVVDWQASCDQVDSQIALSDGRLQLWLEPSPKLSSSDDDASLFELTVKGFCMTATPADIAVQNDTAFHTELAMPTTQLRVLLLSPHSELQQDLKRQLIKQHCLLLPLGDATQLLGFLSNNQEPLDHLVVDEAFIASDPTLLPKIAQVVRRYFPAARLHLVHSAHSPALAHAKDYQCLAVPLLTEDWPAVLRSSPAVRSLMICSHDVVSAWRLQQRLNELGWQAQLASSPPMNGHAWLEQSAQQWCLVNKYGQSVLLDIEILSQAMLSQALYYWLLTGKKR